MSETEKDNYTGRPTIERNISSDEHWLWTALPAATVVFVLINQYYLSTFATITNSFLDAAREFQSTLANDSSREQSKFLPVSNSTVAWSGNVVIPPDQIMFFLPSQIHAIFASAGPEALNIYRTQYQVLDSTFPLAYGGGLMLLLLCTWVYPVREFWTRGGKPEWNLMIQRTVRCFGFPLIGMAFDYLENYLLVAESLRQSHSEPDPIADRWLMLAGIANLVKHGVVQISAIMCLLGLLGASGKGMFMSLLTAANAGKRQIDHLRIGQMGM